MRRLVRGGCWVLLGWSVNPASSHGQDVFAEVVDVVLSRARFQLVVRQPLFFDLAGELLPPAARRPRPASPRRPSLIFSSAFCHAPLVMIADQDHVSQLSLSTAAA